ncbi:MAG: hypothetical protein M1827_004823 [Pycnora praestabilis]|nr:MAG: hypothetical protein M1827_004823 [Pycnora praestabilis]
MVLDLTFRQLRFELKLKVVDLNNVPLVSGTSYIKWHLPSSTSAEHRGRTPKCIIKDHKVEWNYEKILPVRLHIDKSRNLIGPDVHFEILQEYSSGSRGERIVLGYVKLNLAEYVEGHDADGDEGITRRYLMQESKINSTLKVSIVLKQLEGDKNFIAPPLKTAAVFGGITGIVAGDRGDQDDPSYIPSLTNNREIGESQDIYRRTLTASWSAQLGELAADECIEDIFSGGDGWGRDHKGGKGSVPQWASGGEENGSFSDNESKRGFQRNSSMSDLDQEAAAKSNGHVRSSSKGIRNAVVGRKSIKQQQHELGGIVVGTRLPANEIDELKAREHLRSWEPPRLVA